MKSEARSWKNVEKVEGVEEVERVYEVEEVYKVEMDYAENKVLPLKTSIYRFNNEKAGSTLD